MYALLLTIALTPDVPVASHKAAAGCVGSVAVKQGCTSAVKYVAAPTASCYGTVAARSYRTPIRSALHRATAPKDKTTYYAPAAVYVPTATIYQSAAPPVYRAPVRNAAAAVVQPRRCPIGVICP